MKNLDEKYAKLAQIVAAAGSVGVAFSGGADSSLLLFTACRLLGREKVVALTAATVLQAEADKANARELARHIGCEHVLVDTDPLLEPLIAGNPSDRCYHCKKKTYGHFFSLLVRRGVTTLLDGTNVDDSRTERPGLRALDELGVASPLWRAGLQKTEVRILARQAGLPNWDRPSSSCLATRIPAGTDITVAGLASVARLEDFLAGHGLPGCRARLRADTVVVELPAGAMVFFVSRLRSEFIALCLGLGFSGFLLDLRPRAG